MDIIVIILFVIVAILAYILYFYFYNPKEIITDLRSLNSSISIPSTQIINPNAEVVYYEMWIYLNSEPISKEVIFSHGKLSLTLNGQTLAIESIDNSTSTPAVNHIQTMTTNFPIQKWMYITIVRKSDILESYLNGKLVKTNQFLPSITSKIDTTTTDIIIVGNTRLNGYMTKFNRLAENISSEKIWTKYLEGNGVPSSTANMQNYQAGIEITQNNQLFGYYKLF